MCGINLICKVIGACYLLVLAVIDIKTRRLPTWVLGVGALAALAYQAVWGGRTIVIWGSGAAVGLLFLGIGKVTGEALGYGDGILIGILGIFLGVWDLLGLLVMAFFLSALYAAAMLAVCKFRKKSTFPFVPFLGMAYVIMLAAGGMG